MNNTDNKYPPCIGCGFCCTKAMCDAGRRIHGVNLLPCPSLEWNGDRHICKLMVIPGNLGERYRKELYAGEGCCANLNSWYCEPLVDRTTPKEEEYAPNPLPSIMQIFITALSREFISSDKMSLILGGFQSDLKKSGYSESAAKYAVNRCIDLFNNQRSSFMKNFMG